MSLLALTNQLTAVNVPLNQLFLDPNNPRFIESSWTTVPDELISDGDIQESTLKRMVQHFAVDKLRMSMEVNGYLPIDRVIVRAFGPDQFVVLEGNRRVGAAKLISNIASDGTVISPEVTSSLLSIPVLQYTGGDVNAAWIFQGLRHISGIEDWSAFNKAKLLVEQMESDELTLTDAGKRFGLTPFGAGQWVRGYYAYKQASEESEYIAEVNEKSYPYFQELFGRSSSLVREWMAWDDDSKKFDNKINFNEFVGWLYPRPKNSDNDGESSSRGDWESRWVARRDDIRDVAYLIREEPDLFQQFRSTGQLESTYAQALTRKYEKEAKEKADPIKETFDAISICAKALENLPLRVIRVPELHASLKVALEKLQEQIKFINA